MKFTETKVYRKFRQYVSPAFIALLLLSMFLWYMTKLNYEYMAEVPVEVNIAGNRFTVSATAEGPGYRLLVHKFFRRSEVRLEFTDVRTSPSVHNHNYYVVDPHSLQNAISLRNSDIRIISVGDIPEITFKVPR